MNRIERLELDRTATKQRRMMLIAFSLLFLIAFAVRLVCAFLMKDSLSAPSYFLDWMQQIHTYGLGYAFTHNDERNASPLQLVLLGFYAKALGLLGITPQLSGFGFKLPSMLVDAAAGAGMMWLTKELRMLYRLLLVSFFLLNPAFILNSAILGQFDMLHSFLLAATAITLPKRPGTAGALFALALLAKLQAIAFVPVLVAYFIIRFWREARWEPFVASFAGFLAVYGGASLYFAASGILSDMLKGAYGLAAGTSPYVTQNAMNIWYYAIGTSPDTFDTAQIVPGVTLRHASLAMFGMAATAVFLYVLLSAKPLRELLLKAGAMTTFSLFMLLTAMQGQYAIPALVLSIAVWRYDAGWRRISALLTLTCSLNLLLIVTSINPYTGIGLVWLNIYVLYLMFAEAGRELWRDYTARSQASD